MMETSAKSTNRPPYLIIGVLMFGAFISFLNNTLLNIALTPIMDDLHVKPTTVQWLSTGFMLVSGVMIPTTAFLIEKYSVRRLFLVAMSLFVLGTLVASFAPDFGVLLAGRMVQASGSAIMMPLLMNVMLVSFPIEKRGTAMGFFGLILMFAPAIGPTLSGWIVEHYNWRALFYLIWPIAAVILILGLILLKDKKDKVNIHLDKISLLLSSIGFGSLLFGFSSAGSMGWGSPYVYGTIIIGIISLTLFVMRQRSQERPMLNFGVFKFPMFTLSSAITISVNVAMFSGFMLLPMYAQSVKGFTPMESGLMLLPGALLNAAMSPVTGRLFDKFGGRILAIIGLFITLITTYEFSRLTLETTYVHLMILHACRMLGMSMAMMPVQTNGLNQLPRQLYPHGTAMNNTLNQVSAAIGTAFLITVMSMRQEGYAQNLAEQAMQNVTGQLSAEMQAQIMKEAMLGGINDTFLVSTFITVISLVLAFFIKRAKPADEKFDAKDDVKQPKLAPEN